MKTFLKTILPAFALTVLLAGSASAQIKIATIDLRKTFDGYWKTKQADAALKDRAADMDKEHKKLMEEYTKAKEDYQKTLTSANDSAIATEEKEKRKKSAETKLLEIKEKEQEITTFRTQARTTLDDQRRRMREDVLKEIREAINGKAKSAGYSLVIDTASESFNNTPIVMFSNGENDITDVILSQLNATAPVELPKPAEKKDEKKPDEKKK
ncbi:MAG: OmpH family outer membrane protein [Verrucomicrobia bacterium]|nr:OmpH family outer membrane protein [Verrucomicrobiota bacterium]